MHVIVKQYDMLESDVSNVIRIKMNGSYDNEERRVYMPELTERWFVNC